MGEIHISVSENEWLGTIMRDEQRDTISQQRRPRIPRVPPTLSGIESNKKCYEPLVVSIGPYHHGKLPEMEKSKVRMAQKLVEQSGKPIEEIYKSMVYVAAEARRYYAEDHSFKVDDSTNFTKMMFLDSCFVIQFMYCLLHDNSNLKIASHDAALVKRDMLLLENQLPLPVLLPLMKLRFGDEKAMKLIIDFINHIRAMPRQRDSSGERISKFFRKTILRRALNRSTPKSPTMEEYYGASHLLELFHMHFVDKNPTVDDSETNSYTHRYRPAKELRMVGIHFQPSKTSKFTDIQFNPTWIAGRLEIPPLTIDDSTRSMLLNLVAYEASLSDHSMLWFTSYICFMDSLIDHPEDVKELRSKGILFNKLGSEEEVAKLFNELADYLVPSPGAFQKVKEDIESHCTSTFKRLMLNYKGPFYRWMGPIFTSMFQYFFIFGLMVSALKFLKFLHIFQGRFC